MKLITAMLVLFMLSACAVQYARPDGSPVAQRDYDECEYEAQKAASSQQVGIMGLTSADPLVVMNLRTQCLKLRGYRPSGI